jgi:hypothetical protein
MELGRGALAVPLSVHSVSRYIPPPSLPPSLPLYLSPPLPLSLSMNPS